MERQRAVRRRVLRLWAQEGGSLRLGLVVVALALMGGALAVWQALTPARMAAGPGATARCPAASRTAAAVGQ